MVSRKQTLLGVMLIASFSCGLQAANKAKADAPKPATHDDTKKANASAVNKDVNTNITIDQVINGGQANLDLSVRYVNTMEAMQNSKKGGLVAKNLDTKRQQLTVDLKQQEQALNQAMTEYKSKEAAMSTQARNAEEAKMVKMRRDFESAVKSSEDELKLAMQQATDDLAMDVEKAITEIAANEGYDIVADVYTGRTIYASPKALITHDLVAAMDEKYVASNKKSTKTAANTSAPKSAAAAA